jgi:hypothetical protein
MKTIPAYILDGMWNSWGGGATEFGWFEEDCDWARVVLAFPDLFTEESKAAAERTVRGSWPDIWEKFYGRELLPGESREKDQRTWYETHKGELISYAACGDWADGVPSGMVGVSACKGGCKNIETESTRKFLMARDEYEAELAENFHIGVVINLDCKQETSASFEKRAA